MPQEVEKEPFITDTQFLALFERHVQRLKNLEQPNPRLVVCFAGVPGSGKTTLAKEIESRFLGVRVSTDEIRDLLNQLNPDLDTAQKNQIVQKYHPYALAKLSEYTNGLLILDSSIDRKYQEVLAAASREGYDTYIINFDLPRGLLEERIKRSKGNPDDYLAEMDRWLKEHADFENVIVADITVGKDGNYERVLREVAERLSALGQETQQ